MTGLNQRVCTKGTRGMTYSFDAQLALGPWRCPFLIVPAGTTDTRSARFPRPATPTNEHEHLNDPAGASKHNSSDVWPAMETPSTDSRSLALVAEGTHFSHLMSQLRVLRPREPVQNE